MAPPRAEGVLRALLSTPPLALASFAFAAAAQLAERAAHAALAGVAAPALLAPLGVWLALAAALGAFWLLNALRLAGLVDSPANRLTSVGALATAALGALLATVEPGPGLAKPLAFGFSVACFATAFLLHVALPRLPVPARGRARR